MRVTFTLATAVATAALALPGIAAELTSGLQVGESVTPFTVEKCAGVEDGVKVGAKLCYR